MKCSKVSELIGSLSKYKYFIQLKSLSLLVLPVITGVVSQWAFINVLKFHGNSTLDLRWSSLKQLYLWTLTVDPALVYSFFLLCKLSTAMIPNGLPPVKALLLLHTFLFQVLWKVGMFSYLTIDQSLHLSFDPGNSLLLQRAPIRFFCFLRILRLPSLLVPGCSLAPWHPLLQPSLCSFDIRNHWHWYSWLNYKNANDQENPPICLTCLPWVT